MPRRRRVDRRSAALAPEDLDHGRQPMPTLLEHPRDVGPPLGKGQRSVLGAGYRYAAVTCRRGVRRNGRAQRSGRQGARRRTSATHRHVLEHALAQLTDRPCLWLGGLIGHFEISLS
jgi:hypothetical protein